MSTSSTFDNLLQCEFRWPRHGDKAFLPAAEWQGNAYIEQGHHGRMVMMMTGYKKAADLMVVRALDDRADRDALVYPIIFNYRQFIELSLKYLISTYGHTVGVSAIWDTHDLAILWKRLKEVLKGYGLDDDRETDPVVAEIVAEFAKVDPRSFTFRYPVDTKGKPLPVAHEQLDLAALADVMNALEGYFNGSDGYLDSLQSAGP